MGFVVFIAMKLVSNGENLIEIRPSKFGSGLFSLADIPAGTVLCSVTGRLLTFHETLELKERESHSLQVGMDQYILCDPPFLYSNHSCEPNSALDDQLQLYALIAIPIGKEIFWDYSTSMYERHWTMQCYCGNKNCRRVIEDFDLLPEALQQKYLGMYIVMPFIVKQLAKEKKLLSTRA
jgi:uncharacterized protein